MFYLQITVVGLVTSVNETPTRIDYEIDDMTGPPINVKQFVDNDVSQYYCHTVWHWGPSLPMQSVPVTAKVVKSNPVHGEVYLIQYYVIKFDSDLQQVGGFLRVL